MGERMLEPSINCDNPLLRDAYQQADQRNLLNCGMRRAAFEVQHATWSALEVPVDEGANFCPGDFYYGMAVREPLERLESHLGWDRFLDESYLKRPCRYDILIAHLEAGNLTEKLRQRCERQLPTFDNYLVRMLGGHEVYGLPVGAVSQRHFEKAQATLERFDLVVPTEVLFSDERAVLDLNRELGWSLRPEDAKLNFVFKNRNAATRDPGLQHKVRLSEEQLRYLRHLNKFDISLYANATARYRNRLEALSR